MYNRGSKDRDEDINAIINLIRVSLKVFTIAAMKTNTIEAL